MIEKSSTQAGIPADKQLRASLPELTAVGRPRHGQFPAALTPIIGREEELGQILRLIKAEERRLVTIVGPPGVGKSRFLHASGEQLAAAGVSGRELHFLDFDLLDAETPISAQLLNYFDSAHPTARFPDDAVITLLKTRDMLLFLDNLYPRAASLAFITRLLAFCPGVTLVMSSQSPTYLSGETRFELPPLKLPTADGKGPMLSLSDSPAGQLLLARAYAVHPGFRVNEANAKALIAICHKLDGLPLAIELAARFLRVLSPEQLLGRLDRQIEFFGKVKRNELGQLRSLLESISRSHQCLLPEQQELFRRLSVFKGSFGLPEGIAVTGTDEYRFLQMLMVLVGQGLVQRSDRSDGEPQFTLLNATREFGRDLLVGSGEEAVFLERHAQWFHQMLDAHWTARREPHLEGRLDEQERQMSDIRAALRWSIDQGHINRASEMVRALDELWWYRNYLTEAAQWIDELIEQLPEHATWARSHNLSYRALIAASQGDHELARRLVERSYSEIPDGQDFVCEVDMAISASLVAAYRVDENSVTQYQKQALRLAKASGDTGLWSLALTSVASTELRMGELVKAGIHAEQELALVRKSECARHVMFNHWTLTNLALEQRLWPEFRRHAASALKMTQVQGDSAVAAELMLAVVIYAYDLDLFDEAALLVWAAIELNKRSGRELFRNHRQFNRVKSAIEAQLDVRFEASAADLEAALDVDASIAEALAILELEPPTGDSHLPFAKLTRRELEVLKMLDLGMSDREIGVALSISQKTASNHVGNILDKLGVASRSAAVSATRRPDGMV